MAVVIVHSEQGIFVGHCVGLAFWTLLDTAGQWIVATFKGEPDARSFVSEWTNGRPDDYAYVPIVSDASGYATTAALRRAGLGHMLGDLEANALRYCPVEGTA